MGEGEGKEEPVDPKIIDVKPLSGISRSQAEEIEDRLNKGSTRYQYQIKPIGGKELPGGKITPRKFLQFRVPKTSPSKK